MAVNPVAKDQQRAAFVWAIREQESGGNYRAGNPSGAIGAYQVLASHVADWTRKALGRELTPKQFLDSPAAQDQVADVILGGLYDQYGPEGAASAWYSGDPKLVHSTAPQPGGPSIAEYVREVMGHMAAAPAGLTLPLSGSHATGPTGTAPAPGEGSGSSTQPAGILSWPSDVLGFFTGATDHLDAMARWFAAFTRPSTWVRIGAGGFGALFLIFGIVCLAKAAAERTT